MAGVVDSIYRLLGSTYPTRRAMRWSAGRLREAMHVPNPYADLLTIFRERRPAAILDVGAFTGQTVLKFADEFGGVPIHAFEPTPDSFDRLVRRTEGIANVKPHRIALSDGPGKKRFFRNQSAQTNSLLDNAEANVHAFGEETAHQDFIEVETASLDDWAAANLPTGNLIMKVDVQGAEGLLLDGGKKTIGHRVIAFFCETAIVPLYSGEPDFFALHRRMTVELGFVLAQIYPCARGRAGEALYTDALWVKPSNTAVAGGAANESI